MSSALDKLIENDLVRNAIFDALTIRQRKNARTGFTNFCCPLCVRRGESQDKKFRCGVVPGDGLNVKCFNCHFKAYFKVGQRLSQNMKLFLDSIGVGPKEIQKLAYWANNVRTMMADRPDVQTKLNVVTVPEYPTGELPKDAQSLEDWADLGCDDPNYRATVDYLLSRGDVAATATTYYWSPVNRKHALIIPCYQGDRLVGWTGRAISKEVEPRYHKEVPSDFLFNSEFLHHPTRKYVFIVEGVFDALVIDGVAALGSALNARQIAWIAQSGKQPVVIADRDKRGLDLVNVAIQHQWPVATMHYPGNQWWAGDVKDAADAVKRYGKLYTVQSIVANLTLNKTQIGQRIRYLVE